MTYLETEHFSQAQQGTIDARAMFRDKGWCYVHGFLSEAIRQQWAGDERVNAMAKELLEAVHDAASHCIRSDTAVKSGNPS